jgi:hypothetical protein
MIDRHEKPNHIFTTFLNISHVFISNGSSDVNLLGCYGNLLNGDLETISVDTDFAILNDLLGVAGPGAEEATDEIAKLLSKESEETSVVDLSASGGLTFNDHIFAFLVIYEEDEDGQLIETDDDHGYHLNTYIPRGDILADFDSINVPDSGPERLAYLNSLFAMQYQVYLASRKEHGENKALLFANLTDPLHFNLAKTQYELGKSRREQLGGE